MAYESRPTRLPVSHLIHDEADWAFNQSLMKQSPKLQKVPVKNLRATQTWVGKFAHSPPVYSEYSDHPVGIKDKKGQVHLVDGHHRADNAMGEGKKHLHVYVADARDQDTSGGLRNFSDKLSDLLKKTK